MTRTVLAFALLGAALPAWADAPDQARGPTPIKEKEWFHPYDYPDELPGVDRQPARVLLGIDTHGNVRRCDILESGGVKSHDIRACSVYMVRARFDAARDESGKAISSSVARSVDWRQPFDAGGPSGPPVDFVIDVTSLPGDRASASVAVRQVLKDDGSLESCTVDTASGLPGLDAQACALAGPLLKLGPVIDRGGKPVRAMRVSRLIVARQG